MKKVAFIINPKAGVKKKIDIPEFIRANFSKEFESEIIVWKNKEDFETIKHKLLTENFTIAVAVGGDGTVNKVAEAINKTDVALGILPFGSGNGLARSLRIPMNTIEALSRIESGTFKFIDSGYINGKAFFCTAGTGFDAHIGAIFASSEKRGFASYAKITLKELLSYKPQQYTIAFNGRKITRTAFLITFANAGQYGNDFYIAPSAKMSDGLFHVVVLKPFPLIAAPFLAYKIFKRKAESSKYIETFQSNEIHLTLENNAHVHYDGEPDLMGKELNVRLLAASLKVVY